MYIQIVTLVTNHWLCPSFMTVISVTVNCCWVDNTQCFEHFATICTRFRKTNGMERSHILKGRNI